MNWEVSLLILKNFSIRLDYELGELLSLCLDAEAVVKNLFSAIDAIGVDLCLIEQVGVGILRLVVGGSPYVIYKNSIHTVQNIY